MSSRSSRSTGSAGSRCSGRSGRPVAALHQRADRSARREQGARRRTGRRAPVASSPTATTTCPGSATARRGHPEPRGDLDPHDRQGQRQAAAPAQDLVQQAAAHVGVVLARAREPGPLAERAAQALGRLARRCRPPARRRARAAARSSSARRPGRRVEVLLHLAADEQAGARQVDRLGPHGPREGLPASPRSPAGRRLGDALGGHQVGLGHHARCRCGCAPRRCRPTSAGRGRGRRSSAALRAAGAAAPPGPRRRQVRRSARSAPRVAGRRSHRRH